MPASVAAILRCWSRRSTALHRKQVSSTSSMSSLAPTTFVITKDLHRGGAESFVITR
jgi:hypothetical protein